MRACAAVRIPGGFRQIRRAEKEETAGDEERARAATVNVRTVNVLM